MARRLPPLNALRAFEAAARHLSFTRAAVELNVTQAAISHQVKALEEWLGLDLFRRLNRALRLTEEGQAYLPTVRDALDAIDSATKRLVAGGESRALAITTTTSFASTWLLPRLRRFRALHPDIDLHMDTSDGLVDIVREGIDLSIRYGRGDWPGLTVEHLMEEELFPVCSPALLEGAHPLETPEDLNHHTLLHDDMSIDWDVWLRAAGIKGVDASRGPFYQHSYLVVHAAIDGEGVALGRSALVADLLADGRLVRPFEVSLPANFAYYVASAKGAPLRPHAQAFRDWLFSEVAGSAATEGPS